jgi:hypothetical protein
LRLLAAAALCVFAVLLTWLSADFGYDRDVGDMPVLSLTLLLFAAGSVFAVAMPRLIGRRDLSGMSNAKLTGLMIVAGLVARLILFASEPMLEDDYQRYLWDGAVSAAGQNPYAMSPRDAAGADKTSTLRDLAAQSGNVIARVNHPELRTIYPPVSQAAFALAHWLAPWQLWSWRAVVLVCEGAILLLLVTLLKDAGRSPLWAALYWWNPLVLKEAANSAHMEPLVLALVLLALWLTARRRPLLATTVLGLAAGAKLWPVLLFPLIVRTIWPDMRRVAFAIGVFAILIALWSWPILITGLDATSGFRAYAETWKTNSALSPMLEHVGAAIAQALGAEPEHVALAIKCMLASLLGLLALAIARQPINGTADLMQRAGLVAAVLMLLTPAQYPWYLLWVVPFLAFWPSPAFLLLGALIPLYYASFHFAARDTLDAASPLLLTAIWLPVWAMIAIEARRVVKSWTQPFPRYPSVLSETP